MAHQVNPAKQLPANIVYLCFMGDKQKHRTIIFYKDYFENF
jgi:hypothetical protein